MTKITILVPTRGRAEQCRRMIESVSNTSTVDRVNVYLSMSDEDADVYKLELEKSNIDPERVDICCLVHPDYPTVHKWNELAGFAYRTPFDTKLFMLGADDIIFETPGWDEALLEHYSGLKNKVHCYHLRDSRDENGTPHPCVTREWIEAMGYAFPPIFLHWYLDTWTVSIAKANKCFTHLKDFLLVHDKPSDIGKPDATHTGIRARGWPQRDKYVNDTCQHFLKLEMLRLSKAIGHKITLPDLSDKWLDETFHGEVIKP